MNDSSTVTLSSKYQLVIPAEVRKACDIKPGDRFVVFAEGNHIEFIRVRPIEEYVGFLEGIDSNVERDEEDRV